MIYLAFARKQRCFNLHYGIIGSILKIIFYIHDRAAALKFRGNIDNLATNILIPGIHVLGF